MKSHSLRLKPGEDIAESLDEFARRQHLQAACVLTCVGSLRKAVLRYANQEEACVLQGHFEIVSLTGILSEHGSHYHIAIADEQGRTIGAHLLPGRAKPSWSFRMIWTFLPNILTALFCCNAAK